MNLMICGITSQPAIEGTRTNAPVDALSYGMSKCIPGQALVARSVKSVCAMRIGAGRHELEVDLASRFPKSTLVANEAAVHDDLARVIGFVEKPGEGLYLPLDIRGTPIQRHVREKLRAIQVDRTVTCTQVAWWARPLTTGRLVAGACASNPIAPAIPGHHVVCSNGDLACRRGIERKRESIRREAMA